MNGERRISAQPRAQASAAPGPGWAAGLGITRNVLLLGVVSFLTDVSSDMIVPLLPVFLTEVLRANVKWVGLIEGVAETTASVFKLLSGWISDRVGRRKPLVIVGYALSTISRPLMGVATAGWHILVVRFFDRVGKGVRTAPRDALIAETSRQGALGRAFGFHRAMDNLGGVLGPLAASGILLLYPGHYRLVFWCAFVPGVLTLPFLFAVRESNPPAGAAPRPPPKLTLKPFDNRFRYYLLIVFLFTLGNSSDLFLIQRAKDMGMRDALLPMFWLGLQLVKMLLAYPGGMLADAFGKKRMLMAGWAVYSMAYLGFGLATQQWHLWGLVLFYGFYYGLTEGGERAIVADLVPADVRGTAYGVFNLTVGISLLPASLLTGALYSRFGSVAAFGTCAALSLAAAGFLDCCASAPEERELEFCLRVDPDKPSRYSCTKDNEATK